MKFIIHDLSQEDSDKLPIFPEDSVIVTDNGTIKKCKGCFGCWFQTPGRCILKDDYQYIGENMGKAEELIVISKCSFGSYSSFVKTVFDRSISYILPFFEKREGEMHHKLRYQNQLQLRVVFYGDNITEQEEETAKMLVERNALNFHGSIKKIVFLNSIDKIKEALA